MGNVVEEKLKKCKKCNVETMHRRNNTKSSGFMLLVHLILTVVTWGVWLALIIVWKILNYKVGGWKCAQCGFSN